MIDPDFLEKHSLFGGISRDKLEIIIPLLEEVEFRAGEVIISEGEHGENLYLIYEGEVEIIKSARRDGREFQEKIAVLGPGETFGEMELIDPEPRIATVRARENTLLLSLSNADLYQIYRDEQETFTLLIMNISRIICRRLREMDARMAQALCRLEPA